MSQALQWSGMPSEYPLPPRAQGSATASAYFRSFFIQGTNQARPLPEHGRIDELETFTENWDGRGSAAPVPESISASRTWLPGLRAAAALAVKPWAAPHITVSESGEVVFEWWHRERKITIYFGTNHPEYIKVWGANIETEMESGALSGSDDFTQLWTWLNS